MQHSNQSDSIKYEPGKLKIVAGLGLKLCGCLILFNVANFPGFTKVFRNWLFEGVFCCNRSNGYNISFLTLAKSSHFPGGFEAHPFYLFVQFSFY